MITWNDASFKMSHHCDAGNLINVSKVMYFSLMSSERKKHETQRSSKAKEDHESKNHSKRVKKSHHTTSKKRKRNASSSSVSSSTSSSSSSTYQSPSRRYALQLFHLYFNYRQEVLKVMWLYFYQYGTCQNFPRENMLIFQSIEMFSNISITIYSWNL